MNATSKHQTSHTSDIFYNNIQINITNLVPLTYRLDEAVQERSVFLHTTDEQSRAERLQLKPV